MALMGAMAMSGMACAEAADPVQLSVTASTSGTTVNVSGSLQSSVGQPLSGLLITMYLNESGGWTTATLSDGSYSAVLTAPGAGSYVIRCVWSGDARYSAATTTTSVSIVAPPTALSLSVDPGEVNPGTPVTVSGSLTSGGSPISSAVVTLSVDYGSVDSIVGTGSDGSFSAGITIPEGEGFPARFTVTANYSGDGIYTPASNSASGSIVAPPTPTVEETSEEATPSEIVTRPAGSSPSSPISGIVNDQDSSAGGSASPMEIVSIVFFTVALISVGTLVILGIVSHAQKRLARDERRGFGTNFGKLW